MPPPAPLIPELLGLAVAVGLVAIFAGGPLAVALLRRWVGRRDFVEFDRSARTGTARRLSGPRPPAGDPRRAGR
jgi:hypothetical protein